jgi:transposase
MDQKTRSNPHHLPFSVRDLTADGSWQQLTFEKRCLPKTESALVRSLARDPLLRARVERLMTIPAAGPITALTWVLEVDDVTRFGTVKQAIIYCGLCGAERSSAETVKRMPISKQRNKHLQSVLGEAAKLGPRLTPDLALVYDLQRQKGHANRATLAVARKLVAYLLAVDRSGKEFVVAAQSRAAA